MSLLAKVIDRKVVLSFEEAFSQGVPYLSRSETALAMSLYLTKGRNRRAVFTGPRTRDPWSKRGHKYRETMAEQTGKDTEPYPIRAKLTLPRIPMHY